MKFSIVFDKSGDTIPFVALNPEVVEYYVDQLTQANLNNFWTTDHDYALNLNTKLSELHYKLTESNAWMFELFDRRFNTFAHEDYLDQDTLNYLHAEWVKVQNCRYNIEFKREQAGFNGLPEQIHNMYPDEERFPKFGDVVDKIGKKAVFDSLNMRIHGIEGSFTKIIFKCFEGWPEFKNHFPKNIITNDRCNLFLPFNHLGRTQYNKFVTFDFNLEYNDENTFNELLGFVGLSFDPPQTISYSNEYVNWCRHHNREPSGEIIPLGNIPDLLTNLKKYRIIVLRNTKAENRFRIDLHKG